MIDIIVYAPAVIFGWWLINLLLAFLYAKIFLGSCYGLEGIAYIIRFLAVINTVAIIIGLVYTGYYIGLH
jgi:hypothetical protein